MYLKGIEIHGFKSFADKTNLEFNSGITSVIGPNGSGKSNISDAVRWVLGEQSVRTLRGGKMEDIIFAGTEHRKPLGMAEVSITLDNSDNTLPVEYNEVTITRRIYRSGESEYLINKTSCRLKDIHEILLDTGIGKDGYSIIGQGQVDEILSTRSEDRRHIFEEASGIMKYKQRKLEAEKKLELAKQNILRLNDITNELESQLEPLKNQSETAKKYFTLRDTLKETEVNVYIDSISKYKDRIKEYEEQYNILNENINEENEKIEKLTRENGEKSDMLKRFEQQLEDSRSRLFELEGSIEKNTSEIKLNEEKINNLKRNVSRIDEENAGIETSLAKLASEEASKQSKMSALEEKNREFSLKLSGSEKKLGEIISRLDDKERQIEIMKASIMDKLDILSDKKTQINSLKNHSESIQARQKHISNEIFHITLEKDKYNMKKEDILTAIRNLDSQIGQASGSLQKLKSGKKEQEDALNEKRVLQGKLKSALSEKTTRNKMLKEMEKNHEGYARSVKEILNYSSRSHEHKKGIHGALAQLISVDKKYETAIEVSLGGALQNIVTSTEEDAKRIIEYLKKNHLGRATFLPISSVSGKSMDNHTAEQLKKTQGFCGMACDLVDFSPEYSGIIQNLLGRVAVVNDLDSGISIARKFGFSFRIATLEGDILNAGGSMSGGSTNSKSGGILSRSREISELEAEIERLNKDAYSLENDIFSIIKIIEEMMDEIKDLEDKIQAGEKQKILEESTLAQVEDNIKKSMARHEMLKEEKSQLVRQEEEYKKEIKKYEHEHKAVEDEINSMKEAISAHQEENKETRQEKDTLHRDITDYRISINSISESISMLTEAMDKIHNEMKMLKENNKKRTIERINSLNEIDALTEKNTGLSSVIRRFELEKTGKTMEFDRITEEKKIIEEESEGFVNIINETNRAIFLLKEEMGRLEVRKAKAEAEMDSIQNRLWDEYELTYVNALEYKKDIGSIPQAQRAIAQLKEEIRLLGPVNVTAVEDYLKTRERYDFMIKQQQDMEQAEEKLRRIIKDITSQMKKKFVEQFRLINQNFSQVFSQLFEGGRAELVLLDEENVLESGIDIVAQPPGKKLQNMMLLSGGERALTAIALLFAILKLSPAPFCLLDEIEAALDDANVFRFGQYLKGFSLNTQFIVITHRKGTMEASDTLYGVTMQEHGVSKIVSIKMGEMAS